MTSIVHQVCRIFCRLFCCGWVLFYLPVSVDCRAADLSDSVANKLSLVDLNGRSVEIFPAQGVKASVFFFVSTECPITNRYAPEIRRIHDTFAAQDVAFFLVYPNADESAQAVREHVGSFQYPGTALRDPRHRLVRRTGAKITPEVAVFANGELAYRGRIDNRYVDFGKTRPAPTQRDLEDALLAILAERAIAEASTTSVGCFIADLE